MIQRVQSIFLGLVAVSMFAMLFMPVWMKRSGTESAVLDSMGLVHREGAEVISTSNTMYIFGLALVIATLAVGSLFSYKNRPKQIKLNLLNALLLFVLAGINAYWVFYEGRSLFLPEVMGQFGPGFYLPFVGLFMNSLANRFIMKDEKLVKSVDRLR